MKYIISGILVLIIFSINTSGQSLRGRVWQSQNDENIRILPMTIVLNTDGKYYSLQYRFSDTMKLLANSIGFEEGTYAETKTALTLTRYIEQNKLTPVTYQITWQNNSEFTMSVGIKEYHFTELGSEGDIFTPKYLMPFLAQEQRYKHQIDPCYKELVDQMNIANDLKKDEAINNATLIKKSSLIGTIWQMQMDENREERGRLNNIYFEPNGTLSEVNFNYANGVISGIDGAKKETYREEADGSILRFFNSGKTKIPLDIVWKSEDQIIIGRYYYARFNSPKDQFSANYLKNYAISLVEQARTVYPTFLEVFVEKNRSVNEKRFEISNEDKESAPYLSIDFGVDGVATMKTVKFVEITLSKDYYVRENTLYLAKHKLFSRTNKTFNEVNWEEKWELKWINSQEFTMTKDSKSYHYILQGKTQPKDYEQN